MPAPEHEPVEYDLADWPEEARADLQWMLSGRNIPFEWADDTVLVVPETRADEVDTFLDYLAAGPGQDGGDDAGADAWRVAETNVEGAPAELSIDDFYDGDPARLDSDEAEFGQAWRDAEGVQCEVSWIADTGELFIVHAHRWQPYQVEILAVIRSRAEVERALYGWERAMSDTPDVQWVRDRVRGSVP
jgi:hypothetical protein